MQVMQKVFYNPRLRGYALQVLVLLGTIFFLSWIAKNTADNLSRQGIASGFDFLETTAGFDLTMSLIPYSETSSYGRAFLAAVVNTLLVSFLGIFFATILGFLIGVARLSSNWLLSKVAETYIEIVRNVPLLLQLFFWYFAVLRGLPGPRASWSLGDTIFLNIRGLYVPKPETDEHFFFVWIALLVGFIFCLGLKHWKKRQKILTGKTFTALWLYPLILLGPAIVTYYVIGKPLAWSLPKLQGFNFQGGVVLIPELVSLLLALSIYTASFIAEIVRAGILAISKGQTEAALSLGLSPMQNLRLVVLPQAMRIIIPPLTSQFLNLTKNSSLAAAIAYPDLVLVFAGTVLMQTGQAVEVICMTMAVYLVISLGISLFMNVYNKKMALVER
jgi:general L-amino acid transport system permease protein